MKIKKLLLSATFCLLCLAAMAQWDSIPSFPGVATDGCFSFTIGNLGYVGGGLSSNSFYEYDPAQNQWRPRASVPGGTVRTWSASFSHNGRGYVVGGVTNSGVIDEDMWCFDPDSNKWTEKEPFPGGSRDGMLAFVIGDKAYVGGGFDGTYVLNDFYSYDFAGNSWTTLNSLPYGMLFPSMFMINNKAYVTFFESDLHYNNLVVYDVASDSWDELSPCPGNGRSAGVGFTLNGKGYCGLGQSDLSVMYSDIYEYDPATDKWKRKADYANRRSGWATAFTISNKAYIGTGVHLSDFSFTNKFYTIDANRLSVKDVKGSLSARVYPNPAHDHITVKAPLNSSIELYDMAGRIISSRIAPGEDTRINLEGLKPGFYLVKVNSRQQVEVLKLTVN